MNLPQGITIETQQINEILKNNQILKMDALNLGFRGFSESGPIPRKVKPVPRKVEPPKPSGEKPYIKKKNREIVPGLSSCPVSFRCVLQ